MPFNRTRTIAATPAGADLTPLPNSATNAAKPASKAG
jgi:hypothetical protein